MENNIENNVVWRLMGADPDRGVKVENRKLFPGVYVQLHQEPHEVNVQVHIMSEYVRTIECVRHPADPDATEESLRVWAEDEAIKILSDMYVIADKALHVLKEHPTKIQNYDKNKVDITVQTLERNPDDEDRVPKIRATSFVMAAPKCPNHNELRRLFHEIVLDDIRNTPEKLLKVQSDPNYKVTWDDVHKLSDEALKRHGLRRYNRFKDRDSDDATCLSMTGSKPFDLSELK